MQTSQESLTTVLQESAPQRRAFWTPEREAWMPFIVCILSLGLFSLLNHGQRAWCDYFVPLADAFIHGRLHVLEHPTYLNELVPFGNRWYVVYPPMPAVLLMPFVAFLGTGMNQAGASILVGALSIVVASDVFARLGILGWKRLLFSLMMAAGTIFWFSVHVGTSWHFAQVCATLFLWLAIRQSVIGTKPWLAGLLLGCAALSRLPTLMAFPYFAVSLGLPFIPAIRQVDWKGLGKTALSFSIGLGLPLVAMGLYNYARFGSPFQAGYWLIPGLAQEWQYRFGFMHPINIPRNLHAMFLMLPKPVPEFPFFRPYVLGGMSLLLTTPAFLWACLASRRDPRTWAAWLSILLISLPILMHADPGGDQFGYRYAQDFYPILALLMVQAMKQRIGWLGALAIATGFLVNLWGMYATFFQLRI